MVELERAMKTVELARHYGVSVPTFRSWIKDYNKEIGVRKGQYWKPKQVKVIKSILG